MKEDLVKLQKEHKLGMEVSIEEKASSKVKMMLLEVLYQD